MQYCSADPNLDSLTGPSQVFLTTHRSQSPYFGEDHLQSAVAADKTFDFSIASAPALQQKGNAMSSISYEADGPLFVCFVWACRLSDAGPPQVYFV